MAHAGDVGTEIEPELVEDPDLARRLDDLLHRTCDLARALTGAEQAALKVDLDGDGHAARKFFNLSERYAAWRDYRVDPHGLGLHGIQLEPGQVVRLIQEEVAAHPAWTGFGDQAAQHPPQGVASDAGLRRGGPQLRPAPALRQEWRRRIHGRGRGADPRACSVCGRDVGCPASGDALSAHSAGSRAGSCNHAPRATEPAQGLVRKT